MGFRSCSFRRNRFHTLDKGCQLFLGGLRAGAVTAFDSSPFGRNGTLTNMVPADDWQPDGELGRYRLDFDGTNDLVTQSDFVLDVTKDVSITFWLYDVAAGMSSLFSIGTSNSPDRCQAHCPWSDGKIYWDYGSYNDGGRVGASMSAYIGSWVHVCLQAAAAQNWAAIYLNGVLAVSRTSTDAPSTNRVGLYLGCGYSDQLRYQSCSVSDFCIHSRLLTLAELSPKIWRDPMLDGWLYDPTRTVIPWVSGVAPAGGPFPHFLRRRHTGGMLAC